MSYQAMKRYGETPNAYYSVKKPICKGNILQDFKYMTFQERQNDGDGKNSGVARGWREGMNRESTEEFQGSETSLYDTIMADTCHYTFVQTHRMQSTRVNPNRNYGLQIIMMCECRFINVNNVPLWWDMLIMGEVVHVQGQGAYGNSVLFAQYCCELKTALKNKLYFKNGNNYSSHSSHASVQRDFAPPPIQRQNLFPSP